MNKQTQEPEPVPTPAPITQEPLVAEITDPELIHEYMVDFATTHNIDPASLQEYMTQMASQRGGTSYKHKYEKYKKKYLNLKRFH